MMGHNRMNLAISKKEQYMLFFFVGNSENLGAINIARSSNINMKVVL